MILKMVKFNWLAFCNLSSCLGPSNWLPADAMFQQTKQLWQDHMIFPLSFYLVTTVVHLVFLLSFYAGKIKKRIGKANSKSSFRKAEWCSNVCRYMYYTTLIVSILLGLSQLAVAGWAAYSSQQKGGWSFFLVDVAATVKLAASITMTVAIVDVKTNCESHFSRLMRTWWIVGFVASLLEFCSKFLAEGGLHTEVWLNLIEVPLYAWLCIVGIGGKTGLSMSQLGSAYEPLLSPGARREKVTGYAKAGLLSCMTFSWLDPLLSFGYKNPLKLEDVPVLDERDRAASASQLFITNWSKVEGKSLMKCLVLCYWKAALVNAIFAGLYTCASYVGPFLIGDFVEYLGGRRRYQYEGYVLTSLFFISKIIETMGQRQWFFGAQQLGLRVTAGLSAVMYKKGLVLSSQSRQSNSSGEVINYVSVDVKRLSDFAWFLHDLWLLPIQVSLALLILYSNIGIAALATLVVTALTMLANIPLSSMLEKYQNGIMESKDARMRATTEILKSMKILKLQAWEMKYFEKLEGLRKIECRWLRNFLYGQAVVIALFWCTPAIVAVITFMTCALIGIPLTAGRVLSALATFRILQDPIYAIPDLISAFAETKVSMQRIQKFLQEQELDTTAVEHTVTTSEEDPMAIDMQGACFSWECIQKPSLRVPKLHILKGSKVAVCGQVGSGKSSLIFSILGEMPKVSGRAKVNGSRAYVAQSTWIQTGNIRDNILFGKPFDKQKYDQVLRGCSLNKDLELFSHGDQTEIGERGINLSGGQKQRIQIARALYQDADIYLLDDPFSAVDAHTGSHLFQKCILEMLEGKTVVYVTHQVEFLPAADNILVLEDGNIVQSGKFDDLLQSQSAFSKLTGAHTKALESIGSTEEETIVDKTIETFDKKVKEEDVKLKENKNADEKSAGANAMKQLVQEEERETGQVSMTVYWSLITAVYRGALVPILLLSQVFFQCFQIASNYWMAWATPVTVDDNPKVTTKVLLEVFICLSAASALCILARSLLLSTLSLKTAQKFFMSMLSSIFRAPMSFFDATPTGRILSRVSTDQSALDLDVYTRFAGLAFNVIQLMGIIVVMSQISWIVFLLLVLVLGFSVWLQKYYIASARELARLVGIRRSPIIHHLGESISGVATIRGFNQEDRFINTNLKLIDDYCKPLFHNFSAMEWLCLRLNLLSSIVFLSALLLVVSLPGGTIDAGIAGLAVTYGLNLAFLQYMIIWNLCNLENKIISVERIQQYTNIPSEAPLVLENFRPPTSWPSKGTIILDNLQIQYAPHLPVVLRGISCTFSGGHRIGVVGRTGSGKSTLIQALFRIVEPVGGKIIIDDIDISQIGLHDLRAKLSIIPQDPTLFEGTIRHNLDPLQEHTDADIWKALEKSQLGDVVRAKDEKLDSIVSENGENWSVGQRQLVCLGRALLKRTRILVLDEATASVDTVTDGVIQDTLRSEFTDCTVITIAHRIPTVIDSDCVLFLSDGRVAEYDSPKRLLENRSSLFSRLVREYTQRSGSPNGQ